MYLVAVEWETYSKGLDEGGVEFRSAARESGSDANLHTVQQTDIPDGAPGGVCLLRTLCTHHLLHQLTTRRRLALRQMQGQRGFCCEFSLIMSLFIVMDFDLIK